ncbi:MAG: hypothetical protein AAF500_14220 [Myxococcota bacterium]
MTPSSRVCTFVISIVLVAVGCGDGGTATGGAGSDGALGACNGFCENCIPGNEQAECREACVVETEESTAAGCVSEQSGWYGCLAEGPCGPGNSIAAGFRCEAQNTAYINCLADSGPGGTGDLGTLTVSGPDTAAIGTSFTPASVQTDIEPGLFQTVTWQLTTTDSLSLSFYLGSALFPDGTPSLIALIFVPEGYLWNQVCIEVSDPACAGISVDVSASSVTFDGLTLPGDPTNPFNEATGSLTLDGTLTWE